MVESLIALLPQDCFDELMPGGPFGSDAQTRFRLSLPGKAFLFNQESFPDAIKRRISAWHAHGPWTEGLAQLFDVTQEEVLYQFGELANDGRKVESTLVDLTPLQRIAHHHLSGKSASTNASSKDKWKLLLGQLDQAGVPFQGGLKGNARKTLTLLRQKGSEISSWSDSYDSTSSVVFEDRKPHTLRREVMRFVQNAAQQAEYQLAKVWNTAEGDKLLRAKRR